MIQRQKGGDDMELLNLIPYGRDNAVSRADLVRLPGWNDRKVRDEIKRLLRNGGAHSFFQQRKGILAQRRPG